MRYLEELPVSDLRTAGDAAETLTEFRACLPPDGMLVMLAGKFRDDVRDVLGMKRLEPVCQGREFRPLDELADEEFAALSRAVGVLVGRFTPFMDDPELITLLSGLYEMLAGQAAERARLLEEIRAS